MITPEYLEYQLNILETHTQLQESILRDIARRIVKAGVTETASWQTEKLQECGLIYSDITKELSKVTGKLQSEIAFLFEDMQTEVFNYDDELIIEAGYEPKSIKNISPSMKQTINAALKKTTTEAINLTKTTAITSQNLYISACDLAHMQITSGAFSYQEAIKNAVKHAARQGVRVIYKSGWVSELAVAIRRSALTGINQTAGKLQTMRAEEMNVDIMELTAHYGARPDHAEWQGQLVSLSGKEGYLTTDDIGYGAVDGFMGANCRHNWNMFFEGISTRNYTDEELKQLANETVSYNGKEMLVSQGRDMQRSIERGIKTTKRELVMLDEGIKNATDNEVKERLQNEFNRSAVKLKGQEAKLSDFCRQTGLKRDRFREQVFATETENGIRNWSKSVSQKAVWANKKELDKIAESGIIKINKSDNMLKSLTKSDLKVEFNQKGIENVASKYGIDIKGKHFIIEQNKEHFSVPFYGRTDADDIGRIDLYPRAFAKEEDMVRTLIHEHAHYLQLKKYGKKYCEENVFLMEKEAYRFEDIWYQIVNKRR